MDRLEHVLETFGLMPWTIERAKFLRDEMNQTFQADVTDDFVAGLLGETEPMARYGLAVRPSDIPVDTMTTQVHARIVAYGSRYLELVAGQCWCGEFHMDPFTDLWHELITVLRIPRLVEWMAR